MSTENKTVEVDVDILKNCYDVFSNFGKPSNSKRIGNYAEALQTLEYYIKDGVKTIQSPTEKLYSLDLLHQFILNRFDSSVTGAELKKALETFEYENKRSKAIAEFVKEYDSKHTNNG